MPPLPCLKLSILPALSLILGVSLTYSIFTHVPTLPRSSHFLLPLPCLKLSILPALSLILGVSFTYFIFTHFFDPRILLPPIPCLKLSVLLGLLLILRLRRSLLHPYSVITVKRYRP
jgi:hypothetical protein